MHSNKLLNAYRILMVFWKKRAIRKYISKLPEELSRRYGGTIPYTEGQVRTTINEVGLNKRYIEFAFVLFCSEQVLAELGIEGEELSKINNYLVYKAPIMGSNDVGLSGDGGGGFGDGGGGGGD